MVDPRGQTSLQTFVTLSLRDSPGLLFLTFGVRRDRCMLGAFSVAGEWGGEVLGNETAVRSVVSFLTFLKSNKSCEHASWMVT